MMKGSETSPFVDAIDRVTVGRLVAGLHPNNKQTISATVAIAGRVLKYTAVTYS
jgi:hypothetical protein